MPAPVIPQFNFSRGEISPRLHARVDNELFQLGLKRCENFLVMPTGGLQSRGGFEFVSEVDDSTDNARVIPFVFNKSQAYALVLQDLKMWVVQDGALVTAIGGGTLEVTTPWAHTDLFRLTYAQSADVMYVAHPSYPLQKIIRYGAQQWAVEQVSFVSDLGAPSAPTVADNLSTGTTADITYHYVVSQIDADGRESMPSSSASQAGAFSTAGDNLTISGTASNTNYTPTPVSGGVYIDPELGGDTDTTDYAKITPATTGMIQKWQFVSGVYTGTLNIEHQKMGTDADQLIEYSLDGGSTYEVTTYSSTTSKVLSTTASLTDQDLSKLVVRATADKTGAGPLDTDECRVYRIYFATTGGAAQEIVIYKSTSADGPFGFVGRATPNATTGAWQWVDDNVAPLYSQGPIVDVEDPFDAEGKYPGVVAFYQQRLALAGANNTPTTIHLSQSGNFENFRRRSPPLDDDAMELPIATREGEQIVGLVDLRQLILFTTGAVRTLRAAEGIAITPSNAYTTLEQHRGVSTVHPRAVGNAAIYLDRRDRRVYDLAFSFEADGFTGGDRILLSEHLTRSNDITDWTFAEQPNQTLWAVRDDGDALAMAYDRDQQVLAWSRHETDGEFESFAAVPEGGHDAVYAIVKRTLPAGDKRYIERLGDREYADLVSSRCADSWLSFDGRNTGATTLTITTGTDYEAGSTVTVTASAASTFAASDVDDQIVLWDGGEPYWLNILEQDGGNPDTVVTATVMRTLPTALQNTATTNWGWGRDTFSGLDHLEGKEVVVVADGRVRPAVTVGSGGTPGEITIDIHSERVLVGLAYTCTVETLGMVQGEASVRSEAKRISRIYVELEQSAEALKGGVTDDVGVTHLDLIWKSPQTNDQAKPPILKTVRREIPVLGGLNEHARAVVQQDEPLPTTILAIMPEVIRGGRGSTR